MKILKDYKILERDFYNRDTIAVAKELLGKYLIREIEGKKLIAKIVEVEAYLGREDKAAHTYGGRRTDRTEVMYGECGFSYVYFTYGMHNMLNVVTREREIAEAVLIRAVEVVSELDKFSQNRFSKSFEELNSYQRKNLTNGPAKLTSAMKIDRSLNGVDLTEKRELYIVGEKTEEQIISAKRIGIDYAEEAVDFLYRFYIKDNKNVSKI